MGHSGTGVVEDMNAGVNILSCGTSNPGKIMSWVPGAKESPE